MLDKFDERIDCAKESGALQIDYEIQARKKRSQEGLVPERRIEGPEELTRKS